MTESINKYVAENDQSRKVVSSVSPQSTHEVGEVGYACRETELTASMVP